MDTTVLKQIGLLIVFLLAVFFVFSWYAKFMASMSQRSIQKRIEKGKISDKKLKKLYQTTKKNKGNKFVAFLVYGIFFNSFLKMQEGTYRLYKDEMVKRNLL